MPTIFTPERVALARMIQGLSGLGDVHHRATGYALFRLCAAMFMVEPEGMDRWARAAMADMQPAEVDNAVDITRAFLSYYQDQLAAGRPSGEEPA